MKSFFKTLRTPARPWGILTALLLPLTVAVLASFSPHAPEQIPQDPPGEIHENARTLPMPANWKALDPNWLILPPLHPAARVVCGLLAVALFGAVVLVIVRSSNSEECQLATFLLVYVIGFLFSIAALGLTHWKIMKLADVSPELQVNIEADYPYYLRTLRPELVALRTVCVIGIAANFIMGLLISVRLRIISSGTNTDSRDRRDRRSG